jgi:hypothetical protein
MQHDPGELVTKKWLSGKQGCQFQRPCAARLFQQRRRVPCELVDSSGHKGEQQITTLQGRVLRLEAPEKEQVKNQFI